jgi:hypothetical protein
MAMHTHGNSTTCSLHRHARVCIYTHTRTMGVCAGICTTPSPSPDSPARHRRARTRCAPPLCLPPQLDQLQASADARDAKEVSLGVQLEGALARADAAEKQLGPLKGLPDVIAALQQVCVCACVCVCVCVCACVCTRGRS